MANFDDKTKVLIARLYKAWSSCASALTYAELRDELLAEQEQIDTRIAALGTVVKVAHPSIIAEADGHFDPEWEQLFTLAKSLEANDETVSDTDVGKRKGHDERIRLRNLAIVASFWSPQVVSYYGWQNAAQGQMKLLRACAIRYSRFEQDFCPRLNHVLLDRHIEAVRNGRQKTLKEAPLQPYRDFDTGRLAAVAPDRERERLWTTSTSGKVPVDRNGTLLRDIRPYHFHLYLLQKDDHGMLTARLEGPANLPSCAYLPYDADSATAAWSSSTVAYGEPFAWDVLWRDSIDNNDCPPLEADDLTISPQELLLRPIYTEAERPSTVATGQSIEEDNRSVSMTSPSPTTGSPITSGYSGESSEEECIDSDDDDSDTEDQEITQPSSSGPQSTCMKRKNSPPRSMRKTAKPRELSPSSSFESIKVSTPLFDGDETELGLEQRFHNRYHALLTQYIDKLSKESSNAREGDRRKIREQWLTKETRWARAWVAQDSDLAVGAMIPEQDAEIIYCGSREFIASTEKGKIFKTPVVVKEEFSDTGMHTMRRFALEIEDAFRTSRLDVRSLDEEHAVIMDVSDFAQSLRVPSSAEDGLTACDLPNITKAHRPLLTMLTRFRLLESLVERRSMGKNQQIASSDRSAASGINFNMASLEGSFSGPHSNAFEGSWLRVLDGIMFWTIVPERNMAKEWASFAEARESWIPNGKQCLIVLEKDDVLFIPPGSGVVFAHHSPTACLAEGGRLWDELSILPMLQCSHNKVRDGPIAHRRLIPIIQDLIELVTEQPDRFRGATSRREFQKSFADVVADLKKMMLSDDGA